MKEGMNRYAIKNRLQQKGYLFQYSDGGSGRKAREASRSDRLQQSRKEQKEVAIQSYGKAVLLSEQVVPYQPFGESEALALAVYESALKEAAPILEEKHGSNGREGVAETRRDPDPQPGHRKRVVMAVPDVSAKPTGLKRKTGNSKKNNDRTQKQNGDRK